ncbi:polyprenol reductase-like [Vespa velutina]|uniref:polyprenol reductase-like n=1 Tax=Vespa velutina TaxID=202808 RepID=UPI001FB33093|nr:polyprenol reductase-like [Vespa velutina]XP_047346668.1 polyprenol reductase-like [Vespa velutina]XP_047346669.1 polyprenol reductase-like [Vespa velutina]
MDVNFIRYLFIFNSCLMTIVGFIVIYVEPYLPVLITRTFHYGKHEIKIHQPLVAKAELPKRWFKHFYLFATPVSTCSLILFFYKYFMNGTIPEIIYWLLDISLGKSRKALISPECGYLAITLFTFHCWKRLYETHYVTVFSDKKMNISHYIAGYIHYIGAILSIMGESHGFVRNYKELIYWHKLTLLQIVCAIIFLLSSLVQLQTNFILASLRKSNNKVVFNGYKVPHGGLFKYLSAPLEFTEILIYLMLSVILWQSNTFHYITLWVVLNQIDFAVMTHKWYKKTFPNYPKERKILIPYLF